MAHIIDDFGPKDTLHLVSSYEKGNPYERTKILSFLLFCICGISDVEQDSELQDFLVASFENVSKRFKDPKCLTE